MKERVLRALLLGGAAALAASSAAAQERAKVGAEANVIKAKPSAQVKAKKDANAKTSTPSQRIARKGADVEFSIMPTGTTTALMEGEFADLRFRITDTAGQPLRGPKPGAWLDMAQVLQARGDEQKSCKDKVSLYLKGAVGIRPLVDLNSYFVVLMNSDSTLAVVDPLVSMAGATSTFGTMQLKAPGGDWAAAPAQRRLYVSMPRADAIAIVDTDEFKVVGNVPAGKTPLRVALQPDGRYLWIGNNAADAAASGVTVFDTSTGQTVAFIATGAGHHEFAFSSDGRRVFVSNRSAGTVSVLDTVSHKLVAQIAVGQQPLALSHSKLSRSLYVADGQDGHVSVIDTASLRVRTRIALKPGLGPLRVTPDGRHALAVNAREDLVHVIDTATNELVQDVKVTGEPFELSFSETYAYVRSLHTEQVHMLGLASLGKGQRATVQQFAAGTRPPGVGAGTVLASGVSSAANAGSVFVVNPSDGTTYYYQEGMNAPASNYRVHGASPRAVTVVDRSLKQVSPGVYEGRVRLPAAGKYDVAFMLQQPQILHCFTAEAAENPSLAAIRTPLKLEFQTTQRAYKVGDTAAVRFRLTDGKTGQRLVGAVGISALHFLAPGRGRTESPVDEIGDGVYEVKLPLTDDGAWYVHVAVPSYKMGYEKLPFFSLQATRSEHVTAATQ